MIHRGPELATLDLEPLPGAYLSIALDGLQ